ncbi:MAG: SusC/RagA family TonB-linked outer membrane protein [Capnocytophaga sp.]|nr:SusC/RagA family TonB-linked outer membrane protein [Capnocytophaga sp.]
MKYILLGWISILSFALSAQNIYTLKGLVKDQEGVPLEGVTLQISGTYEGITTTKNGTFVIQTHLPQGELVFTFIGMKTIKRPFQGNTNFQITMQEDLLVLDGVQVTAKQNINEIDVRAKTGNVGSVKVEQIKNIPVASMALALQGKVPGLRIINRGELGQKPQIRIRGNSSLRKGDDANQPLFILDGKMISADTFYYLNPEDIKDMKVLKDAVATALYGIKASNGVIEITSKRGGEKRFNYHTQTGFTFASPLKVQLMNSSEKLELERLLKNEGTPGYLYSEEYINRRYGGTSELTARLAEGQHKLDSLRAINTNWHKELTNLQIFQKHDLSFQNGKEKSAYYFSLGYLQQDGQIKGNDLRRISARLALDQALAENAIITLSVNGAYAKTNTPNGANFSTEELIYRLNPYETKNSKRLYSYPNRSYSDLFNQFSQENTTKNLGTSLSFNWKILPNLELSAITGLDFSLTEDLQITPETAFSERNSGRARNALGTLVQSKNTLTNFTSNIRVNYEKAIGKHEFTIGANADNYTSITDNLSVTGHGLYGNIRSVAAIDNSLTGAGAPSVGGRKQTDRNLGFGGLLGYTYNSIYNLFGTYKLDAASILPAQKRWNAAWAIGASINVKKYPFLEQTDWLSQLDIRGSYGQTANAQAISPSLITATFKYLSQNYADTRLMTINALPNPNLKAEQNLITDLGISATIFKTNFQFSVYKRTTKDALLSIPIPSSSGFDVQMQNIGVLENKGIEASLSQPLYTSDNWRIVVGGNISYNENKVIDLYGRDRIYTSADQKLPEYQVGKSTEALYGLNSTGINPITGLPEFITADGRQVNATTTLTGNDFIYLGQSTPPISGSIDFYINYKNWQLNADFYYALGGVRSYSNRYIRDIDNARFNAAKAQLTDMWWQIGDENKRYPTAFYSSSAIENLSQANNKTLMKTDFIRFANLSLRYQFTREQLASIGKIQYATLGVTATNIGVWSSYKESDPETSNIVNPLPPTITLNLNIAF